MTTEQLAERCSTFLGAPNAMKRATLNGLFAGKRKSLSITELSMLSNALHADLWDFVYPAGEEIEVRPGRFAASADALVSEMFVSLPIVGAGKTVRFPGRLIAAAEIVSAAENLADHVVRAIAHARVGIGAGHHLASAAYEAFDLRVKLGSYERTYREDPPSIAAGVSAVVELSFNRNEVAQGAEAARRFEAELLAIEYLFAGVSIGEYKLGGPGGQPQAEA
ncbi:MAG: hypothetical protein ACQEW8_10770 [Actinomycetota bacterium]